MKYLAHTKDGKTFTKEEDCQTLEVHEKNVSISAKEYADIFGAGREAEIIGAVHDEGKRSCEFQQRIRGEWKRPVKHAVIGAKLLKKNIKDWGEFYGMVVDGHHAGLKNLGNALSKTDGSYYASLASAPPIPEYCEKELSIDYSGNFKSLRHDDKAFRGFCMAMYIKMLFSSLVDADYTDTGNFCNEEQRSIRADSIETLCDRFADRHISGKAGKLNRIRDEIFKECMQKANDEQGIFSLSVPTGGGKTFSSLAFALQHAKKHGLRRIIYVIPYISIIQQNARVIAELLGDDNVLEHHYNADFADDNVKRWASENWDIPVVITTNVRFFESLYTNNAAGSRRVHNIANSVVIFDEVQMLPVELLSPCVAAINELVANYGVSAVLCSATQPPLEPYFYKGMKKTEIISKPDELYTQLESVEYNVLGKRSDEQLAELLQNEQRALVVVNKREHAYCLAKRLRAQGKPVMYLSTLMTPIDRVKIIEEIKKLGENDECIVVSTSLIEAGVDIDFPVVYRSLCGIDNVVQAAGRANRERKLSFGKVYVFESEDYKPPRAMQYNISAAKEIIDIYGEEAFTPLGVKRYYERLYGMIDSERHSILDKNHVLDEFRADRTGITLNFKKAAEKFKMIEQDNNSILIPMDEESARIAAQIREGRYTKSTLRRAGKYVVGVYPSDMKKLNEEGVVVKTDCGISILCNPNYYDSQNGLKIFEDENQNAQAFIK